MNLNEYQKKALRTSGAGHDRLRNGLLGLMGESGEIVDALKKYQFQSGVNPELPVDTLIKEAGDVCWYLAEMASGLDMELEVIAHYSKYKPIPHYEMKEAFRADLEQTAVRILCCAVNAYMYMYDGESTDSSLRCAERVYLQLEHLCKQIGTTLEHVMMTNVEKLLKRYPDGFDPERSMHRPEYEAKGGNSFESEKNPV